MSIEAKGVGVHFGGVIALSDVSITVEPGLITAVIGPNGSGKSTLFNSITGLVPLATGSVLVDRIDLQGLPPHRRIAMGIGRTFQTPRFDPASTVLEAVMCGFFPTRTTGVISALLGLPAALREERSFHDKAMAILGDLGLSGHARHRLSELSMGHLRMIEVARAVANDPKYILLDEPAAGLTAIEQRKLADELKRLAASGVGVMLVEHNFALVRSLADHALLLHRGAELCRGQVKDIESDPRVIEVYLGTSEKAAA